MYFRTLLRRAGIAALASVPALAVALAFGGLPPVAAAAATCQSAGNTGLTAAVIATSNQTITGAIDATNCDVGIYVGPGVTGVTVEGATVTGASNHGIFVEDSSSDTIENSVVEGNGTSPNVCPSPPKQATGACIHEDKAIEIVGSSHVLVQDNTVTGNKADGGIGIADDGPTDPGALNPGTLMASHNDTISGNVIIGNSTGCGVVVAAYNPGAGVSNNVVENNIVEQNVAGVVVAADSPHTSVLNNDVKDNVIEHNFLPGVIVHANTPGDTVVGTDVENNVLVGNGGDASAAGGKGPKGSTGVVVAAEPTPPGFPAGLPPAAIHWTTVKNNTYVDESTSVFVSGAFATFQ